MSRLFIGNFTFEHELAPHRRNLPDAWRRLNAELAFCWAAIAEPRDWLFCPARPDVAFLRSLTHLGLSADQFLDADVSAPLDLELTPWGWTDAVREWGVAVGAHADAPPQPVVSWANARRTSHELEIEYDVGLDGAKVIDSMAALESAIGDLEANSRWVLKAEFSGAARERMLGCGPVLSPQTVPWIQKRFARGDTLFFEPWVERLDEVGVQWDVPRRGVPVLEGVVRLLTAPGGEYRGSRFDATHEVESDWAAAVEITQRAALQLQQSGYFGPLGIDVMRYRNRAGNLRVRPLQDINARWTMGRLALGWRRRFTRGVWRHGSVAEFQASALAHPCILRTSPETLDEVRVEHVTWLELDAAPSADA